MHVFMHGQLWTNQWPQRLWIEIYGINLTGCGSKRGRQTVRCVRLDQVRTNFSFSFGSIINMHHINCTCACNSSMRDGEVWLVAPWSVPCLVQLAITRSSCQSCMPCHAHQWMGRKKSWPSLSSNVWHILEFVYDMYNISCMYMCHVCYYLLNKYKLKFYRPSEKVDEKTEGT